MRLTDIVIRTLSAPDKGAIIYPDDQLPGFGVRVSQGGSKAFTLTFGVNRERVTIGRYPVISLAEARAQARRILAEHTLGKHRDPRVPFAEALERYMAEKRQKNRPSTVKEYERILQKYFAALHKKNLGDITTHNITKITDRLMAQEVPGTARHAHATVRAFLRWCERRRYIQRSPVDGLEMPSKAGSRDRVLNDQELAEVVHHASQSGVYGKFLLMLIYSGQRRGEMAGLEPNMIDRDARTITLPKGLTKNHRQHTFPYGAAVAEILATLPTEGLLFPARGRDTPLCGFSKPKVAFDKRCQIEHWTLHDLRRTCATGLQRLGVRLEVIETLLNHVSGMRAGIVGIYQRHNYEAEMRCAVELWEHHIASLAAAAAPLATRQGSDLEAATQPALHAVR